MHRLRLKIDPIIKNAEDIKHRVERELPHHTGLISLAGGVAMAAREAQLAALRLRRPFGLHRLPAVFLGLALLILVGWIYVQFFRTTTLTIAVPDRDAHMLQKRIVEEGRLKLVPVVVAGSQDAIVKVDKGEVDLAFIQGGIPIGPILPRLETPLSRTGPVVRSR